jgi:type I restriction enzyme, R subunit
MAAYTSVISIPAEQSRNPLPAMAPEQEARAEIDKLLAAAGWSVQPRDKADLTAAQGVAICEYPLKKGHGFADYLLYVDGAAVGVIEAKKTGIC